MLLLLPLSLFLLIFYLIPLCGVLSQSLFDPQFTFEHYAALWKRPVYVQVLLNTLNISFWSTCVCIVLGYPLAYGMTHFGPLWRNFLMAAVTLPFWISVLVRTYSWMIILGRFGVANEFLQWTGLTSSPMNLLYNRFGVFVGLTYVLLPYVVFPMHSVMAGIDRNLVRAADSLGARPWQAFCRVFLPLSLPGVAAGFLLSFIIGVGAFVTPALMGGPQDTVLAMSIDSQLEIVNDWGFASALSVILLFTVLILFGLCLRFMKLESMFGNETVTWENRPGTAKTNTPHPGRRAWARFSRVFEDAWLTGARYMGVVADALPAFSCPLPCGRWVLRGVCLAGAAFLLFPLGVIMPIAFSNDMVLRFPPQSMGLGLFQNFFDSAAWMRVTMNSLRVAVLVTFLATILGTLAAMGLDRLRGAKRHILYGLLISPLIVPAIINAVALYFFMAKLQLIGTVTGLVLAHTVFAMPFVIIIMTTVFKGRNKTLEQAGNSLGAGGLRTLWHITLPLIRPGLITAGLFAFIASFDELIIALFVSGSINATLPKQMWDGIRDSMDPTIAAVAAGLIILAVSLMSVAAAFRKHSAGSGD